MLYAFHVSQLEIIYNSIYSEDEDGIIVVFQFVLFQIYVLYVIISNHCIDNDMLNLLLYQSLIIIIIKCWNYLY